MTVAYGHRLPLTAYRSPFGEQNEEHTMNEKTARVQIRPQGESAWCTIGTIGDPVTWQNVESELLAHHGSCVDDDPGYFVEVGLAWMTDAEVEELGEFDGR